MIIPAPNVSMGDEYDVKRSSTSGARYHRVDTYSVYGGRARSSLARPKSANFTVKSPVLGWPVVSRFSGFRSRCMKPCLCMCARP